MSHTNQEHTQLADKALGLCVKTLITLVYYSSSGLLFL